MELERTWCLGPCPVYIVRVQADGAVYWHGKKSVTVLGDQASRVNPSDAAALIQGFRDRGFWSLCGSYTQKITDLPASIKTVHVGNQEKRVLDYAQSAPKWLTDLEMQRSMLLLTLTDGAKRPLAEGPDLNKHRSNG